MIDFQKKSEAALLVLGHGSTENASSSQSVRMHAGQLRRRELFEEVHVAFWKEKPAFNEVLDAISAREVYIVPAFISEGYFTRQIIPRELGITGRKTETEHHLLYYCDPVGSHPSMTDRLLARASEMTPGIDPGDIDLIIIGHGTPRDQNSSAAVKTQVTRIQARNPGYAKITDAYLSEAPLINDWRQFTQSPHVIVVPFFIADGLHSEQDIPEILGLDAPVDGRFAPQTILDRTVYYSQAIGTDPGIADVILEQVLAFDSRS